MALPTIVYATDEDLAIRAGADFTELAPQDQAMAAGNDGAFASGNRWLLTSASIADFAAQGVAAGQVAVVHVPRQGGAIEPQHLIVSSVAAGGLTLRRKGLPAGQGQPPAPAAGQAGIQFSVATLAAEIARASFELNHRFGIDDAVAGRAPGDLSNATELLEPCVLSVLWKRYFAIAQRGNPDAKDTPDAKAAKAAAYWAKARQIKEELDELLDRVVIHWNPAAGGANPGRDAATTRFNTRISR